MPRLSKLLEKLEDRIANRCGRWYERNKARAPLYAVLGGVGWYFYGMLLNSLKLGRESVFNTSGEEVESSMCEKNHCSRTPEDICSNCKNDNNKEN